MNKLVLVVLLSISILGLACFSNNTNEQDSPADTIPTKKLAGVRAILTLEDSVFESSRDVYVKLTILNNDSLDFRVQTPEIQQAILALRITNLEGGFMPTIPPSLPPKEVVWTVIKPMEAYLTTYDLNIFSPPLANGRYFVDMKSIPSNKVAFQINGN